ncbi:MAG: class B sortase [Oscillospiraceae bacterium]|nr:class B sortase [Oscillospiraceae bacterium]MBQ3048359.1 class B sortase [Oscillospiraceae bacterium]MBQ9938648.1 class B sortase [Oscillospiraceae bacterium]
MTRKSIAKRMICLVLAVVCVFGVFASAETVEAQAAGLSYDNLKALGNGATKSDENQTIANYKNYLTADYASGADEIGAAEGQYNNVVGWLSIPGTNVNYPVVQNKKNNDYYLYRDAKEDNYKSYEMSYRNYKGKTEDEYLAQLVDKDGQMLPDLAIFADYECKFNGGRDGLSWNTLLYGHNFVNSLWYEDTHIARDLDTMFGQLPSYENLQYAQDHQFMYFSVDGEEMVWQIFAVASVESTLGYIYPNPEVWKRNRSVILRDILKRSEHIYDVDVTTEDNIMILSTCSNRFTQAASYGTHRFIVCAKLLDVGETPTPAAVYYNPNPYRAPNFSISPERTETPAGFQK